MSYRPTVFGTRHAISAGHYLAASAGFAILEGGGNAIDAGVAAGIALGVLQPDLVNFAGVAPILIRLADGTTESIAGLGWWPKAVPADLFMRDHGGTIPDGVLRTVVPAAPDAWITALRRHGTMRFADVAASAIRFSAEGFAVYPLLAQSIGHTRRSTAGGSPTPRYFCPGVGCPRPGTSSCRPIWHGRSSSWQIRTARRDRTGLRDSMRRTTRFIAAILLAISYTSSGRKPDIC
jgi:gamma-glutamyltranspeptidase / glutathione hydrolase